MDINPNGAFSLLRQDLERLLDDADKLAELEGLMKKWVPTVDEIREAFAVMDKVR